MSVAPARIRDWLTLPAGEIRTGCAIAAACAAIGHFSAIGLFDETGRAALVPLALHAACAALAYLLFVNLTKRKLGAPLIAAALFATHPAVGPLLVREGGAWEIAGTALALLSGVLLARTPLAPRLVFPSLLCYAASLLLAPAMAPMPFLVAAAVVGYHGLEPARLLSKRLLPRFAVFFLPLAVWCVGAVLGGSGSPGFARVPRVFTEGLFPFGAAGVAASSARVGIAIVVAVAAAGILGLRTRPQLAWPLLGLALSLAASAFLPDAWGGVASVYAPLIFLLLLAAEGIEELFQRFGAAVAMPLLLLLLTTLVTLSHLRAGG